MVQFQNFGTENENNPSHHEVLNQRTVKLRVSDDLSVLLFDNVALVNTAL